MSDLKGRVSFSADTLSKSARFVNLPDRALGVFEDGSEETSRSFFFLEPSMVRCLDDGIDRTGGGQKTMRSYRKTAWITRANAWGKARRLSGPKHAP